jgi:hypothetical protein
VFKGISSVRKAQIPTANYEPIIYKTWETRYVITIYDSMISYRDTIALFKLFIQGQFHR